MLYHCMIHLELIFHHGIFYDIFYPSFIEKLNLYLWLWKKNKYYYL